MIDKKLTNWENMRTLCPSAINSFKRFCIKRCFELSSSINLGLLSPGWLAAWRSRSKAWKMGFFGFLTSFVALSAKNSFWKWSFNSSYRSRSILSSSQYRTWTVLSGSSLATCFFVLRKKNRAMARCSLLICSPSSWVDWATSLKAGSRPSSLGFMNSNWLNNSVRLFSIGVPVMQIRFFALSSRTALAAWESKFLIAWDSSRMQ